MYSTLLVLHSLIRWFVLLFLLLSIYKSFIGYWSYKTFTKIDDTIRHWTATLAHIQLIVGMLLYIQSPIVKFFWNEDKINLENFDSIFYGVIHITLMFISIIVLTIGSALAKRKSMDKEKFKTILIWFFIALLIILMAIPWAFSPLSNRPNFRAF